MVACTCPIEAWPGLLPELKPGVFPAGPRPKGAKIVFSAMKSYNGAKSMLVPCGKCINCRLNYAQDWATRCDCEQRMHELSCFITMTYNDGELPDDYGLSVKHVDKFWKRLRRRLDSEVVEVFNYRTGKVERQPVRIRYMLCGEYGPKTNRPHYHAAVFGWNFPDRQPWRRTKADALSYVSPLLTEVWSHGNCELSELTTESAAYIAKYAMKKITGEPAPDHYTRLHPVTGVISQVRPEFLHASRKPGLGSQYFERYRADILAHGFIMVNGKKKPVPDYFLRKFTEQEQQVLKAERVRLGHDREVSLANRGFLPERSDRRLMAKRDLSQANADRYEREDI